MPTSSEPLLRALGLNRHTGSLYQRALRHPGATVLELAASSDMAPSELLARLEPLVEAGLVELDGERLVVLTPAEAVGRLLSDSAASAAHAHQRLEELAGALPHLGALTPRSGTVTDREPVDAEIEYGGGVIPELRASIEASAGDLLWLRPDQWLLASEEEMATIVAAAIASGRRSRAILPIRALTDAPSMIAHRTDIGEEIRVMPELPTRLAVIGGDFAMLAEALGYAATPRTVVRQRTLVEALGLLFEQLWDRAAPLVAGELAPSADHQRRFLLEQLAAGAQDEQIARRLSVSLRTVRRRVAELLAELGAESRFQAGVEAARRGWLGPGASGADLRS